MAAILTFEKTWQWTLNDATSPLSIACTPNTYDSSLKFKNTLKKFPAFPCLIKGSSNAVTAGMDDVDRWSTVGDIVRTNTGGAARSWIVIYFPATGIHWLWHCFGANSEANGGESWVSMSAGFTGGSTTERPTATDEIALPTNGTDTGAKNGQFYTGSNVDKIHVWHSSDGLNTMMVGVCSLAAQSPGITIDAHLMMGRMVNPMPGWPHPNYVRWTWQFGTPLTRYLTGATVLFSGFGELPEGGRTRLYATTESMNDSGIITAIDSFTYANEISGSSAVIPVGEIWCPAITLRGVVGNWPDLWSRPNDLGGYSYGSETSPLGYGNFIDDSSTAVIIGHHVYPWDPARTP